MIVLNAMDNSTTNQSTSAITEDNSDSDYMVPLTATESTAKSTKKNKGSMKEPLFYYRLIATYPMASFFVMLSSHVALAVVTVALIIGGYDIFPTYFKDLPMDLYDLPYQSRSYAWYYRNFYPQRNTRVLRNVSLYWARKIESYSFTLNLFYETDGGNIFTQKNLQTIQKIEKDLTTGHNYSEFCATQDRTLKCKNIYSIIQFFDGTLSHINPIFNDTTFENINSVLYEAKNNNETKDRFRFFLPQKHTLTLTSAYATMTRTRIPIGYPHRTENPTKEYLTNEMKPKLIAWKNSVKDFQIYYISWFLFFEEIMQQTLKDLCFAAGSICFIFCFIIFHTRSLWITFWAVFSICTSYLGTNLIYRCLIGYQYFGYFHIVTIFIILGIGADDLFVFCDIWRLTSAFSYKSLAHRLADAYSKSMFSMFITSLTTSVAFFVSAMSPFLCTKSFGVFAGILVMINYLSVITFFPAVIIVYHLKFESCKWPCVCCCNKNNRKKYSLDGVTNSEFEFDVQDESDGCNITNANHLPNVSVQDTCKLERFTKLENVPRFESSKTKTEDSNSILSRFQLENVAAEFQSSNGSTHVADSSRNLSRICSGEDLNSTSPYSSRMRFQKRTQKFLVVFMRDYYFRFITNSSIRFIMLLLFGLLLIFFIYHAAHITPDNEQVQFFKNGHNFARARYLTTHGFVRSDDERYVTVYILWGIKERDRSGCNFTSVECKGEQVYDEQFDPNPPRNQLALKTFCNRLHNLNNSEISDLKIRKDPDGNLQIACFARNMDQFFNRMKKKAANIIKLWNTSNNTTVELSDYMSLPWNYTQTMEFMEALPMYYRGSFNNSFKDYFDIPLQFWLLNGNTLTYTPDFTLFNNLIGEQVTSYSQRPVFKFPTYYGNRIKYLAIRINTTIDKYETGYVEGIPIVEKWENFVNHLMKEMPDGLQNGFQLTEFQWDWLYVQKAMANSAIIGVVLGVTLAFPIITISTMNVVIGLLATLSICCTTVCVIGVIPLAGWKLGLLVSLNMCIIVGLSVDYVVHLAEGYHRSEHKDRLSRTRDMLQSMGSPIISGAITTLGASLFLFFCKIQFALQFGVFLFCNIGFSLLFSLGLFSTLMGFIGPENDTGSLKKLYHCCLSYVRKQK